MVLTDHQILHLNAILNELELPNNIRKKAQDIIDGKTPFPINLVYDSDIHDFVQNKLENIYND